MNDDKALTLKAEEVEALPEAEVAKVLAAHVKAKKPELAQALSGSKVKAVAKAAKKALYQLESSGVQVKRELKVEALAPPIKTEAKEEPTALLSHVLGTGEQAGLFVRPMRQGLELYQLLVHDEWGIQRLDRVEASRDSWRKHVRTMRSASQTIEVGFERIQALLAEAYAQNVKSGNGLPQGADELLRRLDVRPSEQATAFEKPSEADLKNAAQGETLFEESEIQGWLPGEAMLSEMARRTAEVQASPLELTPAQKREQMEAKVKVLAGEHFATPGVKERYAGRLARMAEFFAGTGRAEKAEIARAEARRLAHATEATPFAVKLFRRVMDLAVPSMGTNPAQLGNRPVLAPPGASGGGLLSP